MRIPDRLPVIFARRVINSRHGRRDPAFPEGPESVPGVSLPAWCCFPASRRAGITAGSGPGTQAAGAGSHAPLEPPGIPIPVIPSPLTATRAGSGASSAGTLGIVQNSQLRWKRSKQVGRAEAEGRIPASARSRVGGSTDFPGFLSPVSHKEARFRGTQSQATPSCSAEQGFGAALLFHWESRSCCWLSDGEPGELGFPQGTGARHPASLGIPGVPHLPTTPQQPLGGPDPRSHRRPGARHASHR